MSWVISETSLFGQSVALVLIIKLVMTKGNYKTSGPNGNFWLWRRYKNTEKTKFVTKLTTVYFYIKAMQYTVVVHMM